MVDKSNDQDNSSLKNQLNTNELRFLEFYFSGAFTIKQAMDAAGFSNYHPKYLHVAARKILEKYEKQMYDQRKTMRAMGYGETRILQMLINLAENAKSEKVRLNVLIFLGKCLGLDKEVIPEPKGVTIIIKGHEGQEQPAQPVRPALPATPGPLPYKHPQPPRPTMAANKYK